MIRRSMLEEGGTFGLLAKVVVESDGFSAVVAGDSLIFAFLVL